jgi:hypothetical protein
MAPEALRLPRWKARPNNSFNRSGINSSFIHET